MDTSLWLVTSLFSQMDNWHSILHNGIPTFLNKVITKKYIEFYIELNYTGGANIRLAILVDEKHVQDTSIQLDTYFKHFFSQADFITSSLYLPGSNLFMPFPLNTVQYGLYTLGNEITTHNLKFKREISKGIISELSENSIDEGSLILFFVTFKMIFIKFSLAKYIKNGINLLDNYINNLCEESITTQDFSEFSHYFEDNSDVFNEILDNTLNESILYNSSTLYHWALFCKDFVDSCRPEDLNLVMDELRNSLLTQLGLSPVIRRIATYLIIRLTRSDLFIQYLNKTQCSST